MAIQEKHRGLDIEDEDDREGKRGGAGGNYGGASVTEDGNHGFDLDLGSEAPPSYRSPFDDDDDAGYGDGGNISPSDPFRQQSFESRNHTDFSSPIDNDNVSPSADFNGKGFSSSHGEAFTHSSEVDVASPFTYPFLPLLRFHSMDPFFLRLKKWNLKKELFFEDGDGRMLFI